MPRATRCPQCQEPVSPFAAGCALCGADLEAHRARLAARRSPRDVVPVPAVRLPRVDDDVLAVGLVVLVVLLAPIFGLLLAVLAMRDPRRANVRLWLGAAAAAAVLLTVVPALRYGLLPFFWA